MQLAAFRIIQSTDGTNLTHNFRPVQPLDGRVVYRNNVTTDSTSTSTAITTKESETTTKKSETTNKKSEATTTLVPEDLSTESPIDNKKKDDNSGQQSMWTVSRLYLFYLILQYFKSIISQKEIKIFVNLKSRMIICWTIKY